MTRIFVLASIALVILSGCVQEQPIGGETDEHGCLGSAGYTWCEAKQKCLREWEEPCDGKLNITQARDIVMESDCMLDGNLTTNYTYNNVTDTWWIDMDIDKPGCAPACVVFEENNSAEINWRCTGLVPE